MVPLEVIDFLPSPLRARLHSPSRALSLTQPSTKAVFFFFLQRQRKKCFLRNGMVRDVEEKWDKENYEAVLLLVGRRVLACDFIVQMGVVVQKRAKG